MAIHGFFYRGGKEAYQGFWSQEEMIATAPEAAILTLDVLGGGKKEVAKYFCSFNEKWGQHWGWGTLPLCWIFYLWVYTWWLYRFKGIVEERLRGTSQSTPIRERVCYLLELQERKVDKNVKTVKEKNKLKKKTDWPSCEMQASDLEKGCIRNSDAEYGESKISYIVWICCQIIPLLSSKFMANFLAKHVFIRFSPFCHSQRQIIPES